MRGQREDTLIEEEYFVEMKTKEAETVTLEFYCGNFLLTTVTTWGSYLMG